MWRGALATTVVLAVAVERWRWRRWFSNTLAFLAVFRIIFQLSFLALPPKSHAMSALPASASPTLRLTDRQEAFCQAMACNVGGAEAARRAGYSPKGAKQRGAYLMQQQEIRVRVQQIRSARRQEHQSLLDEAAAQVEEIIAIAQENKRGSLALRAIEFRLKLRGVIQDRRIAHHCHMDQRRPDADLEDLDCDPEEEFDALPNPPPSNPQLAKRHPSRAAIASKAPVVTLDSDLLRFLAGPLDAESLLGTTAATALIPALVSAPPRRFRMPRAA